MDAMLGQEGGSTLYVERYEHIKASFADLGSSLQDKVREAWSAREFGSDLWRAAVGEGLLALMDAPTGAEAISGFGAALEGLAAGSGDPGFLMAPITHCALGMRVIRDEADPGVREEWLARLGTGEEILAFAIAEPMRGAEVLRPETRLRPDGKGFRLDGSKWHVANVPVFGLALVWATDPDNDDIAGVMVDTNWEGVTASPSLAAPGTSNAPVGSLSFDGVHIPASHVLGRGRGRAIVNAALVRERILVGFACIGILERVLRYSVGLAVSRREFGTPIATYQHVQRRLCDIKLRLDTTRALTSAVMAKVERGDRHVLEAAQLKMYATRSAMDAISGAVQLSASYGSRDEAGFYQMLLDSVRAMIAGGAEEAHRMVIMQDLLCHERDVPIRGRVRGSVGAAAGPAAMNGGGARIANGLSLVEALRGLPLFTDCLEDELAELAAHCAPADVSEGWAFIIEGMLGDTCYLILEGQVRVSREGQTLAHLGPGHLVGEVALLEQRSRTATVCAETPVRLLCMDAAEFNGWLNDRPELRRRFLASRAHGGDYGQ